MAKIGDLTVCTLLISLLIAAMLLVGQRDYGLESINTRIDALQEQVGHGNIPRIEITRASVYAGSGQILIDDLKEGE